MPDDRYTNRPGDTGRPMRPREGASRYSGDRRGRPRTPDLLHADTSREPVSRRTVVKGFLGLGLVGCVWGLAGHQIFYGGINEDRHENRITANSTLYAKRGAFYDRNGNVLAASEECYNIALNTTIISNKKKVISALVKHLGMSEADAKAAVNEDSTWTYVARKVSTDVAEELLAEGLAGIEPEQTTQRVYPYGTLASQVIGVVDTDNNGLTGLELYYDEDLQGENGWVHRERAADNSYIAGGEYDRQDPIDGDDLVLTIDVNIQRAAEEALAEAVENAGAHYGSVIVTDPRNGEILAACSYPTYDPANLSEARTEDMNLRVVTDAYEPGSVFKALVCGAAIDLGLVDTETTFSVPPVVLAGDDEVTDVDSRDYEMTMTVREIMRRSSNTGMILVGEKIGADSFAEYLDRYGIGHESGVDFPGENTGIVRARDEYDGASVAAMSFGQAIAVSPIEITRAISAISNKGVMTTPHFLMARRGEEIDWTGGDTRAISEETASKVADMMLTVVDEGTGEAGQVPGYEVSGKTGTAQRASESGGYLEGSYMASFMGFAPTKDPQVQVYVTLDGTGYTSIAAAPAFAEIMSAALDTLGVKPTR
ncbi:peptidoglycan D,D-transpeptidase FtsI family protein [Collinsella tanakaei]|uniref:peptidoglycan D,D-transpeptidase FtsI family protein n=1 Tax=Collinsella tanakaei TaxID=626935 RepID=UPI001EF42F09|nr:penicillin-binding protein 2 [Collinsella tanakaei]